MKKNKNRQKIIKSSLFSYAFILAIDLILSAIKSLVSQELIIINTSQIDYSQIIINTINQLFSTLFLHQINLFIPYWIKASLLMKVYYLVRFLKRFFKILLACLLLPMLFQLVLRFIIVLDFLLLSFRALLLKTISIFNKNTNSCCLYKLFFFYL